MRRLSDNGRYVMGEPIGSGGQGRVYEGRQLDLDRRVAIKQLRDGDQIRHEARLLAALRHPHILTVHELIEFDGRPALVMEFVEGSSLGELVAEVDLSTDNAEALWFAILDGVAHAHRLGVVHGDLTPANVMVQIRDGKAIPKICDFGVGRSAANPVGATGSTDGFVAPELRHGGTPTLQSDVYGLAALGRFLMPGVCRPEVDEALSLAMTTEPSARPEDAIALARGLVRVRRPDLPDLSSAVQPSPVRTIVAAVGLTTLCLGAGWWALSPGESSVDPRLALAAMERWSSHPAQAAALWHAAGAQVPAEARAIGADSLVLPHDEVVTQLAASANHLLSADHKGVVREWDLANGTVVRTLHTGVTHPQMLQVMGDRVVLVAHPVLGENPTGCVVWSLDENACTLRVPEPPMTALLAPSGQTVWYVFRSTQAAALSIETGETLWQREHNQAIRGAIRSDRPDELLQWTADSLDLVDLQTGRRKQVLANPPPEGSGRILWSKAGARWGTREQVHTVQEDGTITTWPSTGHLVFETPLGVTHAGARSLRGTLHAAHGQWALDHHGWHDPVDWGGPWLLATTLAEGSIQLLDARDGHLQRKLVGHTSSLLHMVKVGDWLATASHDHSVRLWRPRDADSGWLKRVDTGLRPSLVRAGERVAVLGRTSSDRWAVWTPALGGVTLGTGNTSNIDAHARQAAMVNDQGALTVVDLATGEQRVHATGMIGTRCVELATELDRALLSNLVEYQVHRLSDGEQLATGPLGDRQPMHCAHLDAHGAVWRFVGRPAKAHQVGEPPMQVPFDGVISGVHFAPHALVLRGFDGQIAIQRGETLELVVPEHAKHFTVTDKALAWTGNQGIVHFESEPSWASGPGSRIHALAFAAGNRLLLAGRDNGHLDVWTRTGEQIASVQAHAHPIHEIDVDAQTGHIITIDTRGVAQWWEPGRLFTESTDVVTNLRTCRGTERVVPVLPFPNPSDRWAPAAACEDT